MLETCHRYHIVHALSSQTTSHAKKRKYEELHSNMKVTSCVCYSVLVRERERASKNHTSHHQKMSYCCVNNIISEAFTFAIYFCIGNVLQIYCFHYILLHLPEHFITWREGEVEIKRNVAIFSNRKALFLLHVSLWYSHLQ